MGLCCSSKGVTLLYVELLSKLCETIFALLDTPSAAPSVRFWRPATTFSSVSCAVPWQHGSGTSCSAVQTTMPAALGAGSSADEFWRGLEGARRVSLYGISRGPAAGPPEAGIFRAQGAIIEPDPWVLIRLVFASTDIFCAWGSELASSSCAPFGGKKGTLVQFHLLGRPSGLGCTALRYSSATSRSLAASGARRGRFRVYPLCGMARRSPSRRSLNSC